MSLSGFMSVSYKKLNNIRKDHKVRRQRFLEIIMYVFYIAMMALTASVIRSANRATGTPIKYAVLSSTLWPAWWLRYMLTEEA